MGWFDTAKEMGVFFKKVNNIEMEGKLLELREAMHNLQEENLQLKNDIGRLTESQNLEDSVQHRNDAVYRTDKNGEDSGPFCHTCWGVDRKLVHLSKGAMESYFCRACHAKIVGNK